MADVVNSDDEDVPRVPLQRHSGPITRHAPTTVDNKPLFIRYPNREWILFDEKNVTARHQKRGLEMFIESGEDQLDVSIPLALGGQFMVRFNKTISQGENDSELILYSYTPVATGAVQMMYADPAYVAYINRVTT